MDHNYYQEVICAKARDICKRVDCAEVAMKFNREGEDVADVDSSSTKENAGVTHLDLDLAPRVRRLPASGSEASLGRLPFKKRVHRQTSDDNCELVNHTSPAPDRDPKLQIRSTTENSQVHRPIYSPHSRNCPDVNAALLTNSDDKPDVFPTDYLRLDQSPPRGLRIESCAEMRVNISLVDRSRAFDPAASEVHPELDLLPSFPGAHLNHTGSSSYFQDPESSPEVSRDPLLHNGRSKPSTESEDHKESKPSLVLFAKPLRRSLADIIEILALRHKENYYIGWSSTQVLQLSEDQRPTVCPVTPEMKQACVPKSVQSENKKLAFAWFSASSWGDAFRQKVKDNIFKGLSEAKREAAALWKANCPEYDVTRAVRKRDDDGNIVLKRTRMTATSENEYRQHLKKSKMSAFVDQIWSKRAIIGDILQKDNDSLQVELRSMQQEVKDYRSPGDASTLLADIIAFKLRKVLLSASSDKL